MPTNLTKLARLIGAVALCALALLGFWLHTLKVDQAQKRGYEAGVVATANALAEKQRLDREVRDLEKAKLEAQTKEKVDAAEADANTARDAAGKLQHELTRVRDLIGKYSPTDTSGKTAGEAVGVLGDLLQRHIDRNRELAQFADKAYLAGLTCERQYDSLMVKYGKSDTADHSTD